MTTTSKMVCVCVCGGGGGGVGWGGGCLPCIYSELFTLHLQWNLYELVTSQQLTCPYNSQGPVVQSIVSLTGLLMTNLLIIAAEVFSNTFVLFAAKNVSNAKALTFFQQKISMYLPYFKQKF